MNEVFEKMAPILHAKLNAIQNDSEYWTEARNIVAKFTESEAPNPQSDFIGFAAVLYKIKDSIFPTNPEQCLPFLEKFVDLEDPNFMTVEFPRCICNPILAIQTFRYLHLKKNKIWLQYIEQKGAIGRVLDLFLPFLTPLVGKFEQKYWSFRLEMCDLLTSLILTHFDDIPLVDDFVFSLNRQITLIIADAPIEMAVNFVRFSIQLNTVSLPKIKPETAGRRITNLIKATPPGTPAHAAVLRFASKGKASQFISRESLLNIVTSQEITSSYDLEMVAAIANQPNHDFQLIAIKYLAKIMTSYSLYSRTAAVLLAKILGKHSKNEQLKSWTTRFIRRLFIWIVLASQKGKYIGKTCKYMELFLSDTFSSIPWFSTQIDKNIVSVKSFDFAPSFFSEIQVGEVEPDEKFKSEYDSFKAEHVNMKVFPFASVGNNLFETPDTDPKKKKKKPTKKQAKKATIKTTPRKGKKAKESDETEDDKKEKPAPKKKAVRRPAWKD